MVTEQMTENEKQIKKNTGECPIDIALDKWKRLRAWIEENYTKYENYPNFELYIDYHADTCALCTIHYDEHRYLDCNKCVITKIDRKCSADDGIWTKFDDSLYGLCDKSQIEDVFKAADDMIALLKRCKEYAVDNGIVD